MSSRSSAVHSPHKAWGLGLMIACGGAAAQGNAPPVAAAPMPAGSAITRAESEAALATLRADPNLPGERTIKTLRWTNSRPEPAKVDSPPSWLVGLFDYLAQTGSLVLWLGGGLAVGFAAIWLYRIAR